MRILLIGAPQFLRVCLPPLGLGYLASVARREGHEVRVLSLTNSPSPTLTQIRELAREYKPDLVGHTVLSPSFNASVKVCRAVKDGAPEAKIVLGGPHPTALPAHSLRQTVADYAIMGEGEITFAELLRSLNKGEFHPHMPGLAWRNGEIHVGRQRTFAGDVDAFPEPAWDLLAPESYPNAPPQALQLRKPATQMLTSRGCPYYCSYCAANRTMSRDFRGRNTELVADEMERLQRDHSIQEFMLLDLNFTYDRTHASSLADTILRRGLDIAWKPLAGFRIDEIDEPLLRKLKKAGCYQLIFGIESFHPETLKKIRKDLDAQIIHERINMAKKLGFFTASFFIIGSPGETEERIRHTIHHAAISSLDFGAFFCWTPMPGAADWAHLKNKIDVDNFKWENLNYDAAIFSDTIPAPRLTKLLRLAHARFYITPRRWPKLMRLIHPLSIRYFLEFVSDYVRGTRGQLRIKE
jgi:radical SAM superfamily enzyme YgiQ (UPF0313 family)